MIQNRGTNHKIVNTIPSATIAKRMNCETTAGFTCYPVFL